MNKLLVGLLAFLLAYLSGCGLQSKESEAVGQVKRITKQTPIFCPDQTELDMSLGVMRNGVGSVSQEDLWLRIQTPEQEAVLKKAQDQNKPVRVTYDVQRWRFCWNMREVTKVEVLE